MTDTLETPASFEETEAPVVQNDTHGGSDEQTGAEQHDAAPEPQAEKTPEWMQRRINKAVYQQREAERQSAAHLEELERMRRALADTRGEAEETENLTPDQIRQQERQRIEDEGAQTREAEQFVQKSNSIAESLAAKHGNDAVNLATQLLSDRAGLDFGNKSHRELIADISELPNSGEVYYALAHDPDAAGTILDASPRRQYALLSQFAAKVGQSAPVQRANAPVSQSISKAPPPVSAPSGAAPSGKKSLYDANVSPAEFDRLWAAGVRS